MVANCDRTCPPFLSVRRMMAVTSALALGFSLSAAAQTAPASKISADAQSYSSSAAYTVPLSSEALLGAAPAAPLANASPQYGGQHNNYPSYNNYNGTWSHIAVDFGGGFTAPIGNDTTFSQGAITAGYLSPSEGWGYNINVGGGWNFTKKLGALLEYQFNRESMDNGYLNAFNAANPNTGTNGGLGGNINTWSLTLDPVYYLPYNQGSGFFVTGGGGFYRKVTNFTSAVCGASLYYGYYCQSATAYHFSSNQGGFNAGLGWYHKVFGPDSNGKLYVEARYVWVDSPKADQSDYYQGEGTEGLIPVTFGIRF